VDFRDYYQTLGVPKTADEKQIKSAYRKLARKFHPDLNPDDKAAEQRFKEINEAYEVLGDPSKRAKYDQFGHEWRRHQQQGGGQGGFDWSAWTVNPDSGTRYTYTTTGDVEEMFGGSAFSEFFEALFGRGGPGGTRVERARRGADLEHPLAVTLDEAYRGTERLIDRDGRRLSVRIPAGVATGSKVRVAGAGAPGAAGGSPGDLYLVIETGPDARFTRAGDDLRTTVQVPVTTAVLGGEVKVATLAGDVQLTVPAGTQPGQAIRLRGRGMPRLRDPSRYGDLLVTVQVRLPTGLSADEKELWERLRALRSG
jgi:curved DNA-binding protein